MTTDHARFMDLALAAARRAQSEGNDAVGSVIVRDGQVVGEGRNLVRSSCDPTAHAETVAIRDACRRLGTPDLPGSVCYTTVEPCPMCCWALIAAGVEGLVVAARHADIGNRRVGDYTVEGLLAMTGQRLDLTFGVRTAESLALRRAGGR